MSLLGTTDLSLQKPLATLDGLLHWKEHPKLPALLNYLMLWHFRSLCNDNGQLYVELLVELRVI